jgi:hypothetical protein
MSFVKNRRREGRATSGELFPLTVRLACNGLATALTSDHKDQIWRKLAGIVLNAPRSSVISR